MVFCKFCLYDRKMGAWEKDGRTRRTGRTDGRSDAGKTKRTV